jgi:hypothetical protein
MSTELYIEIHFWVFKKMPLPKGYLIKSRIMRWAGHVARIGEEIKVCRVLV